MTKDEIKTQIRKQFSPIAKELNLNKYHEQDLSNTTFSLAYMSDTIGIELNVDISDFFIYALLFKPLKGTIPLGYINATGHRQKIYIQEALKKMLINVDDINDKLQSLGGNYHNLSKMLEILIILIKNNWDSLFAEYKKEFSWQNESVT